MFFVHAYRSKQKPFEKRHEVEIAVKISLSLSWYGNTKNCNGKTNHRNEKKRKKRRIKSHRNKKEDAGKKYEKPNWKRVRSIMSSIGDTSHISDLSAISRISRSSNNRPPTKPHSDYDISECRASSTMREPASRMTATISGVSRISRIVRLLEACEAATNNRAKLELLYECARDEAERRSEEPRSDKLRNILARREASKYLRLSDDKTNDHTEVNLLGIVTELTKPQPSLVDKREISACVESSFRERMNRFIDCYEKSGGSIAEITRGHESAGKAGLFENHETELMRWNDPMNEICAEYYRDLVTCADLLSQWRRLKYVETRELNAKKAEDLLLQAQVAEVQAIQSTRACTSLMFNETPKTVDAFRILSESLDTKIIEMREVIQRKEALKMTYNDASSRDYDQLLKRYTELCNVIRKKERLMEIL